MSQQKYRSVVRVVCDDHPIIYLHPEMPETCGVEVTTFRLRAGKIRQVIRYLTPEELAKHPKLLTKRQTRR